MTSLSGTEHYVSRPDGKVYYFKLGHGKPLVMLHSVGSSGWTWRKLIGKLAEHFTCFNIDMPGFDHSDIPPQKYSIDDYASAIVDVMAAAGVGRTSFLASHSGAIVAINVAARLPERVETLVFDGLPFWNTKGGQDFFENSIIPRVLTDTTSYEVAVPPLETWEESVKREPMLAREGWEKRQEIRRKSRYWMRLSYEAITSYDVELAGTRVKAQALLIYGDREIQRYGGQRAGQVIKGSTLKVIPESPGEAHLFQPEEFLRLALEFLGKPVSGV